MWNISSLHFPFLYLLAEPETNFHRESERARRAEMPFVFARRGVDCPGCLCFQALSFGLGASGVRVKGFSLGGFRYLRFGNSRIMLTGFGVSDLGP